MKEKDRVAQMKKQFIPSRLLQDDYAELEKIFYYLNGLRYHQKPDYDFVRRMLCRCIVNKGVHFEDSFDWEDSTSKGISCSSEGRGESVRKIRGSKHKNRFDANAPYIG